MHATAAILIFLTAYAVYSLDLRNWPHPPLLTLVTMSAIAMFALGGIGFNFVGLGIRKRKTKTVLIGFGTAMAAGVLYFILFCIAFSLTN